MKTNKTILAFIVIVPMLLSIVPIVKADFVSIQQITPKSGTPGTSSSTLGGTIPATSVKVDGSAEPTDVILLSLDDGSVPLSCIPANCEAKANAGGAYTVSFTVPFVRGGTHIVKATNTNVTTLNPVTDTFTVTPIVELEQAGQGPSFLTGTVGRTVAIEASGFAANSPVTLAYDGASLSCTPVPACGSTASTGTFKVRFVVPPSVTGNHLITATDGSGISASTRFSVIRDIQASVTSALPVSPHSIANCPSGQTCVVVGSTVSVGVTGFPGATDVTVFFSKSTTVSSTDRAVCSGTTDGKGSFSCPTDTIPSTSQPGTSPASSFYYTANDTKTCVSCPSTAVKLFPLLVLTPDGAAYNQQVNGQGTGFAPNSTLSVAITCSGIAIHTGSTDASGTFYFNLVVQVGQCPPGIYLITATDSVGFSDTARFILGTHIIPTPIQGIAADNGIISGTDVTVDGFVFTPMSNVVITFDGGQVATVTADSNGGFQVHFAVPEALGGTANARITATDNGNRCSGNTACTASAAFTVLPWMALSRNTGTVGTQVSVEGSGFGNINDPSGTLASHSFEVQYCGANANSNTLAKVPFRPDYAPLDQSVACTTIKVVPLSGLPAPNRLGTPTQWTVWTTGTNRGVASGAFTGLGSFKTSFSAPESWGGYHPVSANEVSFGELVRSSFNGALFRITPAVSITPSSAQSGKIVTLAGTGFFQWEKYTTQTGTQPAQTITDNAGVVIDFGPFARYVDQAHFILNGQVDSAWAQDLYRPVALNARGTIIYWDSLFNRPGGVNGESQFLRVPSTETTMQADGTSTAALTITGYRFEMSNPTYDTSEAATSGFTVTNPAVPQINKHTTDALGGAVTSLNGQINSAMSAINLHVDAQVSSAMSAINSNVNAQVSSAMSMINGHVDSQVSTATSTINGHVDQQVNSAISGINTHVDGQVSSAMSAINTHVDTQVSSAMSSVNAHTDSQISSAMSAVNAHTDSQISSAISSVNSRTDTAASTVNSHTDSQVASLSSSVSSLPQTSITYVIAALAAIAAIAAVASTLVVSRRLKVAG